MTARPPLTLVPPPPPLSAPSEEQALRHLQLLRKSAHGGKPCITALRVLGGQRPDGRRIWPCEGYFDSAEAAARAAVGLSLSGANAVYVVLQPIDAECLHRSVNQFGGKDTTAVSDADVSKYAHLLIDLDPERPKGVSATTGELEAALERADAVRAWLAELGWPDPLYRLGSGNGAHLAYRARGPKTSAPLWRACLEALAARWSDAHIKVDTTVWNPSRITKLAGTWARKGDHTRERPHRVAWLEHHDAQAALVSAKQLRALAGLFEETGAKLRRAPSTGGGLAELLEARGLAPKSKEWKGRTLLDVRCWRQDHGHRSGYVIVQEGDVTAPGSMPTERPRNVVDAPAEAPARRAAGSSVFFARCHHADCDANAENLLAFLGVEEALGGDWDPDAAREIVRAVNATGLCELWEGSALLYAVTDREHVGKGTAGGERVLRNPQVVRTFLDRLPRLVDDEGREAHAFSVWTRHAEKRLAWGSTYDPAQPFGTIIGEGRDARLNRWQGFAYTPATTKRGERLVRAWRESLAAHICAGRKEVAAYLWHLFAWKAQHPTEVPLVFVVLTGPTGTGKNTLALPLVNLFGAHGHHSQSPLSRFNDRLEGRAFVFHDEAEFLPSGQTMRMLKALATEQQLTYEAKHVSTYQGLNLSMHVLASNEARVHVEATDRRVLLLRTIGPAEGARWFQDAGLDGIIGARDLARPESIEFHATLLDTLLRARLPKSWRPFPALQTQERGEAIEEHLPALEAWVWNALQRGVVPGGRTIAPGNVYGEQRWAAGIELGKTEREACWGAFRESLLADRTRARTEGVLGYGSFAGFSRRMVDLLGIETRVAKRKRDDLAPKAERVWVLPALASARATCADAMMGRGRD